MAAPLNILIAEDSQDDADLILRELRHAGFDPKWRRVETEPDFLAEIKKLPDIILSDYSMPQFSGLRAAQLVRAGGLDIPFILISGTVGEDTAVEAMKMGATDYLLKDRLARLGQAVEHALLEAKERSEFKKAEQQIAIQTRALEAAANAILITDRQGKILSANTAFCVMTGYTAEEIIGRNPRILKSGEHNPDFYRNLWETVLAGQVWRGEMKNRRKDGTFYHEEMTVTPVRADSGEITHFIAVKQDITERKRAEEVMRKLSGQEIGKKRAKILWDLLVIVLSGALVVAFLFYTDVLQKPFDNFFLKFRGHLDEIFGILAVLLVGLFIFSYRRWKDVQSQVSEQANIEEALRRLHGELERRVQQRTVELARTNEALQNEIAERRQAQAELTWKTALLEAQVDSSIDGILVVDEQGEKILQNQRMNDLWKIPPEVAQDKDDAVQIRFVTNHTKNPGQFVDKIAYLYSHPDEISRDEIELVDGTILDRYSAPVRDKAGKHYGRIWNFRDITERKLAAEAMRESAEKFRQLAENINEVFWITDATMHKVIYVSPAYEKIWGRSCESLYTSPRQWLEVIHSEDRDRILKAAADFAATGVYDQEFRIMRPDKTVRWIHDRGFPIRNSTGEVYRIAGTAEDITGRKKLEEQFRQSQKMEGIGQLAGGVAHDFNNILAVIQMQSELLKSGGGLSADQSEYADEIGATVQRAAALTRQLLLFSRREVFQPRDLNLSESITNTTKMLRRILGENVRMELKLAAQPMFIHADAGMMDQVLLNLAVNARDAMPDGGQLVIETSGVEFDELAASQSGQARPGLFACLSVSDSGCGIPPEVLPKIFEPFFTTKDVGKGTGLGLATVFGIVQQHQGWINVYSELNHGTTFRIYLPRLAKNAGLKSAHAAHAAMPGGNETILLAEDDPSLRASVRKALAQIGYRILEAPTGVKALEVWKENRAEIHLLLTDLMMPDGMTGKDLAQRILQENPKLKVIYMSGYSAEVAGRDFPLKEGVNFLTKPFQAAKLAETIRNCLDKN